jgi:hypothetical protein
LCFDADQHTAKNAECKRIMPNFRLQVATHNLLNCLVHLHGHDALTCWNNAFSCWNNALTCWEDGLSCG